MKHLKTYSLFEESLSELNNLDKSEIHYFKKDNIVIIAYPSASLNDVIYTDLKFDLDKKSFERSFDYNGYNRMLELLSDEGFVKIEYNDSIKDSIVNIINEYIDSGHKIQIEKEGIDVKKVLNRLEGNIEEGAMVPENTLKQMNKVKKLSAKTEIGNKLKGDNSKPALDTKIETYEDYMKSPDMPKQDKNKKK